MIEKWTSTASDVCSAIAGFDPLGAASSPPEANCFMVALRGLASLDNCPNEYKTAAWQLIQDGAWGPLAIAAHRCAAQLSDNMDTEPYYEMCGQR